MVATLTETLNSLYTTTWAKRREGIVDQVFEKNKLLLLLNQKGMIKYEPTDGRRLEIPLRITNPKTSRFFTKGGTFTISDFDPLTVAFDVWKNLGDQLVRYWEDDKINGGNKTQHLKMMNAKIDTMVDSLNLALETALWDSVGGASTLNYNGIQHLIATAPSTSTVVLGINQSTQTDGQGNFIWRNQQKTSGGVASIFMESDMTNLFNTCSRWGDISVMVSDQATQELGEAEALERVRVVNNEAVQLGLDHITFKGRMWIWSPLAPSGNTYFIDRSHLGFSVDPSVNFTMGPWKPIPNQYEDVVTQIVQRGNFWVDKRQCHGVLTSQT